MSSGQKAETPTCLVVMRERSTVNINTFSMIASEKNRVFHTPSRGEFRTVETLREKEHDRTQTSNELNR